MAMVAHVKAGDIINDRYIDTENNRIQKQYKIVKVFPYMVLTEYDVFNGIVNVTLKRCFSYGDLVQRGMEISSTYYVKASEVIQRTDYDLEVSD